MAMVQSGKVIGNLMIDLDPSNTKLRGRAIRIVQQLTNAGEQKARKALEKNKWNIKQAIKYLKKLT